ncbi:alkylphosphonate utilization protein [Campylobacter fetus]|nr:alkylphosphonate utilization protein [Campylobacter fetus]OCS22148.1 PhnA family protein [Campylobacter fetus subsp. venerealis cfvi97/532]OCS26732.1 PhnA family protein [Campylobacter fetus subsp. venerealis cfvB10]OCS30564.1 PhnA family protein [Campylobacter fetus subsp. venerealis LMG 6570 = CCUG 33900]OCS43081.1 PhnA family protein [Campylobacter fetus subsp. venerealis cfvi02/298]AHE94295.1 PhnA domain-containing protein [Campylobacter fetus subsp. venerealis cfvi03/293]
MAKDSNQNELNNADSVTVIKDLKIKGASATIKRGTTVKNIKLISKDNEVECKIPGIGTVVLKAEFLKKI